MASACVNNITDTFPPYGWLSPRISFSREDPSAAKSPSPAKDKPDLEFSGGDFEFRLEDPVNMLPADELFSDGKLVPLHTRPAARSEAPVESPPQCRRRIEVSREEPYLFSPKAPRCSSRWKDLLGLKKLNINNNICNNNNTCSGGTKTRSLRMFLHRSSKSTGSSLEASSLSLPLLKDPDNELVSISARLSLSSSSSSGGHDHDDLPRHSLDSDRPKCGGTHNPPPKIRLVKQRALSSENATRMGRSSVKRSIDLNSGGGGGARGASVDSPRMNSSGRVIFQGLERSSSSPSTLNGGPRMMKHSRGMERSYSANVRVTPVLNVPVCSLRGATKGSVFGFRLFDNNSNNNYTQKGDGGGRSNGGVSKGHRARGSA